MTALYKINERASRYPLKCGSLKSDVKQILFKIIVASSQKNFYNDPRLKKNKENMK